MSTPVHIMKPDERDAKRLIEWMREYSQERKPKYHYTTGTLQNAADLLEEYIAYCQQLEEALRNGGQIVDIRALKDELLQQKLQELRGKKP